MAHVKLLVVVLGCLLLSGLAAIWFKENSPEERPSVRTQPIVVAAHDIDVGGSLDAASTQIMEWPTETVPAGAISDPHTLGDRTTRTKISRGEPILEHQLAHTGEKASLPTVAQDGKRTISVKVGEVIGLSGFTLAGNHVDVLVNFRNAKGNRASKMVVDRVPVLALVQMAMAGGDAKFKAINAVTLEVTPEQAGLLEIARTVGSLTLLVRSDAGKGSERPAGRRGNDAPESAESLEAEIEKAPAPRGNDGPILSRAVTQSGHRDKVEVYRGVAKSVTEF